jgi:hypothetical protein
VAEIVTDGVGESVVMMNVAVVFPAGTVTPAGTVAAEVLLLASATLTPPNGAGPFRVTVPVTEVPRGTFLELKDNE